MPQLAKKDGTLMMNRTQETYWKGRVAELKSPYFHTDGQKRLFPPVKRFTQEEKMGMILSGEAKMREFTAEDADKCSSIYFFNAFEYPGEDHQEALERRRRVALMQAQTDVKWECQEFIDKFMLGVFSNINEMSDAWNALRDKWSAVQTY